MKKILLKLKSTLFWKYLLIMIIIPTYKILWEYVINFEGKILYLFKIKTKKDFKNFSLKKNDKFLVIQNPDFLDIAETINKNLSEDFLEIMRKKMNKIERPKDHYLHKKKNYKINMFPFLNENTQKKILSFALSEKNIIFVSKYLKVAPVISSIYVNLNVPVKDRKERGPMLWHKDDFGFKSLDIFLPLKNMNINSGPLHYVKEKNNLGVFHKYLGALINPKKGERNKIDINIFEDKSFDKIEKFIGKTGDAIYIDSFSCYHRGGYCVSEERLMLRITYQTPDSISLSNNEIIRGLDEKIKKEFKVKNDYLSNYILFKRNFMFNYLSIQKLLLNFYKLLHYKDTLLINKQ